MRSWPTTWLSFSPGRIDRVDWSASLTLDADHLLWRSYERSFGHRLAVTGGTYWQKNFGSHWIGNVPYEQVYQYQFTLTPWETRAIRNAVKVDSLPALEALTLRAFRALEFSRPCALSWSQIRRRHLLQGRLPISLCFQSFPGRVL
jgi:hypothetical protein